MPNVFRIFTKEITIFGSFIMKRITLKIPDSKYAFFLELVKNLGLEKVEEESIEASQEALDGLEQGFKEVKLIQEGKIKGTPLKEFLDEL